MSEKAESGISSRPVNFDNFRTLNLALQSESKILKKGVDLILADIQPHLKRKFFKDKTAVKLVVLNSLVCWKKDWSRFISYGRANGFYKRNSRYNPANLSSVVDVIDVMAGTDYLQDHLRNCQDTEAGKYKLSKFRPSTKLIDVFESLSSEANTHLTTVAGSIYNGGELICLKDKDGNRVDYKDTRQTNGMRKRLEKINRFLRKQTLTLDGVQINGELHRLFKGSFHLGGRFYAISYQTLAQEDRARLQINGEKVVECVFSNHFPRLLYHRAGLDAPGDFYELGTSAPEMRPALKIIMLACIYAAGFEKACKAVPGLIIKRINKLKRRIETLLNGKDYFSRIFMEDRMLDVRERVKELQKQITVLGSVRTDDTRQMAKALQDRHKAISKFFFSGEGIVLQNLDAIMTETILLDMTRRKIPCFPKHDSYIVPRQHEAELRESMENTYFKLMGKSPVIGIK